MILNDDQIRARMEAGMIDGGAMRQVRNGIISYGVTSFGYDMRCADEWQIWERDHVATIDPKRNDLHKHLAVTKASSIRIAPGDFALCRSVEYFVMPDDVMGVVVGKSTYARCGLIVNVTPLEPGWQGHVTIELSNTAPLPIKVYAHEGIAQIMFHQGTRPGMTYAEKRGKYMYQKGITLPIVEETES